MAFGLQYRIASSAPLSGNPRKSASLYRAGDIVGVYPANACRNNPAPGSPHRILVVTDGDPEEAARFLAGPMERVVHTFEARGEIHEIKEVAAKCSFQVDESRLPLAVRQQVQSVGRATLTQAELEAAVFDKRPVFPMLLRDRGGLKVAARGN